MRLKRRSKSAAAAAVSTSEATSLSPPSVEVAASVGRVSPGEGLAAILGGMRPHRLMAGYNPLVGPVPVGSCGGVAVYAAARPSRRRVEVAVDAAAEWARIRERELAAGPAEITGPLGVRDRDWWI